MSTKGTTTLLDDNWEELLARVEDSSLKASLGQQVAAVRAQLGSLQARATGLEQDLRGARAAASGLTPPGLVILLIVLLSGVSPNSSFLCVLKFLVCVVM